MQKDEIRDRLVEILETHCDYAGHVDCREDCTKCLADHLIAHGVTIQRWIPVSASLPEKDMGVLLYDAQCAATFLGEFCSNAHWFVDNETWDISEFTHWMPLPQAPKEVE